MQDNDQFKEIVFQFVDKNDQTEVRPLGAGHINDSFKVCM